MGYFDKRIINELLSANGLVVGEINLDNDEYVAEVFIQVNDIGSYSPKEITNIISKIESLEVTLVIQGFIHDIKMGDPYKGSWRMLIHFLDEDEIEKWEEKAMRMSPLHFVTKKNE